MDKIYNQEVADYLNNKFGDDFTMAEPFYSITLDRPKRIVIVKDWNKVNTKKRRQYEKAQKEQMNLVGFVL